MNDDDATTLLNRLAERVEVGPVPLQDVIRSGQTARRRRRRTTLLAVAAAVALVLLGGVGLRQALQPGRPVPVAAGPNVGSPAPPGTRLVGIGHAAIAVPADWGTNQMTCGKPTADTVVIDEGMVPLCATTLPQTASDVRVEVASEARTSTSFSTATATAVSVDGEPALRTPLQCTRDGGHRLCSEALWIRQEQALFTATSPRPGTVRRLLGSVRVERQYVAVPVTYGTDATRDSRSFAQAAESLGLTVDTRVVPGDGQPAGWIVGVHPAVGTLLRPGGTVHVTVSAGSGPSGGQATASPGTTSAGAATSGGSRPVAGCSLTPAVQRLVITRSVLPGNAITFSFPRRVAVTHPVLIARLVDALCAAPRIPRGAVYHCPLDNGLAYRVAGIGSGATVWAVDVHASGCPTISGRGWGRWSTGRVWRSLALAMGVHPPTYQTLAGQ